MPFYEQLVATGYAKPKKALPKCELNFVSLTKRHAGCLKVLAAQNRREDAGNGGWQQELLSLSAWMSAAIGRLIK